MYTLNQITEYTFWGISISINFWKDLVSFKTEKSGLLRIIKIYDMENNYDFSDKARQMLCCNLKKKVRQLHKVMWLHGMPSQIAHIIEGHEGKHDK